MFYNGLSITLVRSIPGYAALCLSYEYAKSFYQTTTKVAVKFNSSSKTSNVSPKNAHDEFSASS